MKNTRNFGLLLAQPWAIRAASMAAIMEAMGYRHAAQIESPDAMRVIEEEESDAYETVGGVAIIKIEGVIGKKLPKWVAEMFSMTDIDDVSAMIKLANSDPQVRGILLDIDSPGGTTIGVPEAASFIRTSDKPVFAFADNLIASAAYWLASGASAIFTTGSAIVGSIGIFVPILDLRRMYEMAGMEMEVIKSNDLKAAGYPGTSLSKAQRDDLQHSVDHIYQKFADFVASREGAQPVDPDAMRGQDFSGDEAETVGLIDGVDARENVIEALRKYL